LDVQTPQLAALNVGRWRISWFAIGMFVVLVLAVALRLKGIHDPLLDHPNWRQGDQASIARSFARLQFNLLYPQVSYDGPPPNYVELELQIVPFLAATLYKIFGIHEIFGRIITLGFSVATVGVLGLFGRWLFNSWPSGIAAALVYAIVPGSIYYGRTFTPDAAMVFFLTAALYMCARLLVEDEAMSPRNLARSTALVALAFLAKPVALVALLPLVAMVWERARAGRTMRPTAIAVLLFVPVAILYMYQRQVAEHAEWHWASGIMALHVMPALRDAFTTGAGFTLKASQLWQVLSMFANTVLGHIVTPIAILSLVALPWVIARTKVLLWAWLIGGLFYTYVVVTVERVDYYMLLLLPLAALAIGGATASIVNALQRDGIRPAWRWAAGVCAVALVLVTVTESRATVAPYYRYNKVAYADAVTLSHTLRPDALIVMGHYGPDVMYYIDRFGWEEDPLVWTPFDEESAIKKGARYFISVEDNRLRSNADLCAYLQRFPLVAANARWHVYETDPAKMLPGAERFWTAFRSADRAGKGRAFLDAHHACTNVVHITKS
jgi:4-amino-4-deoxy-L-arabinose transferase-like glycosyltransferase